MGIWCKIRSRQNIQAKFLGPIFGKISSVWDQLWSPFFWLQEEKGLKQWKARVLHSVTNFLIFLLILDITLFHALYVILVTAPSLILSKSHNYFSFLLYEDTNLLVSYTSVVIKAWNVWNFCILIFCSAFNFQDFGRMVKTSVTAMKRRVLARETVFSRLRAVYLRKPKLAVCWGTIRVPCS